MKRSGVLVKDQGKKKTVAFPHGQIEQTLHWVPQQAAFGVAGKRHSCVGGDEEDKAQPIFAFWAKAGPVDGAAQIHVAADKTAFF